MKYLEIVQDLSLIVATLSGAWVAIRGVNTWREQLHGKFEFDLAMRLLRSVIQVRYSIRHVRSPVQFFPAEMEGLPPHERLREDFNKVWAGLAEDMSELDSVGIEAEAYWDSEVAGLVSSVRRKVNELWFAIDQLTVSRDPEKREQFTGEDIRRLGRTVYYSGTEADVFNTELETAIGNIVTFARPRLRSRKPTPDPQRLPSKATVQRPKLEVD